MDLCFDPWKNYHLESDVNIKHPVETWKVAYLVKPGARFSCVQVCKVCKALVFDITSNMVQGVIQRPPRSAGRCSHAEIRNSSPWTDLDLKKMENWNWRGSMDPWIHGRHRTPYDTVWHRASAVPKVQLQIAQEAKPRPQTMTGTNNDSDIWMFLESGMKKIHRGPCLVGSIQRSFES